MYLKKHYCKLYILLGAAMLMAFSGRTQNLPGGRPGTGEVLLPNGWKLSPPGTSLPLGDLPLNMQLSRSGKYLAVTNNGQSVQSIQLISPRREKILDQKIVGKSWYGLAFSQDEKHLYASGGNDNFIIDFHINRNRLIPGDTLRLGRPWPQDSISPTGISVTKDNRLLYTVTKENQSLYIFSPGTKQAPITYPLPGIAYSCLLSPDERYLYISLWGKGKIAVFDTKSRTHCQNHSCREPPE